MKLNEIKIINEIKRRLYGYCIKYIMTCPDLIYMLYNMILEASYNIILICLGSLVGGFLCFIGWDFYEIALKKRYMLRPLNYLHQFINDGMVVGALLTLIWILNK
jgi:hypothetical protein